MKCVFQLPPTPTGFGPVRLHWQKRAANFLVVHGTTTQVIVYDRHGKPYEVIPLTQNCLGLDWNKDGTKLAIIQDKTSQLAIWDLNVRKVRFVDTGLKDNATIVLYSKMTDHLAVGTVKGNLSLLEKDGKPSPIIGKHNRRITGGDWNSRKNLLALVGDDHRITVTNCDGDTVYSVDYRGDVSDISFDQYWIPVVDDDEIPKGFSIITGIANGRKSLLLADTTDKDASAVELAFQTRYGNLTSCKRYGKNLCLVGFSGGYFVGLKLEMGESSTKMLESFQYHDHQNGVKDVAVSLLFRKLASCGDNCVKIRDMESVKEVFSIIEIEDARNDLQSLTWSEDGQLLAVSRSDGSIYVYLTRLPVLGTSHGTCVAYLTNLKEICVMNQQRDLQLKAEVPAEPTLLALGPYHLATVAGHQVTYYEIGEAEVELVEDREYSGPVSKVYLGTDYTAVLVDGQLHMHLVAPQPGQTGAVHDSRIFPDQRDPGQITCAAFTAEFLIYGTENGGINYFLLEEWQFANKYEHECGIASLHVMSSGVRLVFLDKKDDAFVYSPVNDLILKVPSLPTAIKGIIWESWLPNRDVFCAFDEEQALTYIVHWSTVYGPECVLVGVTRLPFSHKPLMLHDGTVLCLTQGGKVSPVTLATHSVQGDVRNLNQEEMKVGFEQNVALKRLRDAWLLASSLGNNEMFDTLAQTALYHLDVELALRCCRQVGNSAKVFALEELVGIEDHNLLAGHVSVLLGQYDHAQELFLKSSVPSAALDLRRDLLQWEQALQLARNLSPKALPFISKEYAQQLEFMGDYSNALLHYEGGITGRKEDAEQDHHCQCGIARTCLRVGDIRRGVAIASGMSNKKVHYDCANILENMKQLNEAAGLYERGEYWDKAIAIHIRNKSWQKVGDLLSHCSSGKLHGQYAKAMEAAGNYKKAAQAYQSAKEFDHVIRLNLDHLQNPEEAVQLVRETNSTEGAKMVARFFQKLGDFAAAIQFLVVSKCSSEAFQMAQSHDQMEIFASVIGDDAKHEEFVSIAQFFESKKHHVNAGRFWLRAEEYPKALKQFISSSSEDQEEAIDCAIETVSKANSDSLTHQLIDYLMGELDGVPKDAKFLFRLYMALKQYREAARTAIIIAREDQLVGNYRNAHDVLFSMYNALREHDIRISAEMVQDLMILHSYLQVKFHVKRGDHTRAARLLIRVADNISKFPAHLVPILTSAVVECHRAQLRSTAFNYAAQLMQPQYRSKLEPKWKKKLETIVRRPDKTEVAEPTTTCPFCSYDLQTMRLDCPECKNTLPYCIITGCHMVRDDWSTCPSCKFPALYSQLSELLSEGEQPCPMCGTTLAASDVSKVDNPVELLKTD